LGRHQEESKPGSNKNRAVIFNGSYWHRSSIGSVQAYVCRTSEAELTEAERLGDLRSPPGNRLEALAGNRQGQHSIRINDQFRVCFVWTAEGPAEVEIVDYH
jgi:proteic killer suppression protein